MPLTLTLTEGVIPKGQEKVAFHRLSDAMLRAHGLAGNAVMTRNVVGSVHAGISHQKFCRHDLLARCGVVLDPS